MSKPTSTVDDPAITREIGETVYALMTELVRGMPRDMSLTSVATLSTLNRLGPRRVTDLAASEGVTQPSMTALVTALERLGHVTRRSDPSDKRASLVSVTDRGRDYVEQRRRAGADTVVSVLDRLTDDERDALAAAVPAMTRLRELKSDERLA
ncbi:MarR family winged helix-turn-helix transcriptional regulator [Williamsia sp. MIQD14]|uniref:MarR family winged helix-turn-helix transcriptional regulator n=1 Tax=Williamsia sp. MIQD14 TaxID=3425703 RepID=UPI003DA05391